MKLYLVRHAHAQAGGDHDASRLLSPLGEEQAGIAGAMLATIEQKPFVVYTSPYVRARQTAGIIAGHLGIAEPIVTEYLSLDSDQRQILELINRGNGEPALLVGHEPHLRELASLLVSGNRQMRVPFGNATTVCISVPHPAGWETGNIEWTKHVDE